MDTLHSEVIRKPSMKGYTGKFKFVGLPFSVRAAPGDTLEVVIQRRGSRNPEADRLQHSVGMLHRELARRRADMTL